MKKIFLFFILSILTFAPVYAQVSVKSLGGTTVLPSQVSTSIQVVEDSFITARFLLKVTAMDSFIVNNSNPEYKIPINKLYLNDGENEFQMQPNIETTLFSVSGLQLMGYTKNYTCNIKNIGVLPPGTYSTRLQFKTQTAFLSFNATYNLSFTVPINQEISCANNPITIALTPENVFSGNLSLASSNTAQILIKSNDNWTVSMDTSKLGALAAKYYFQITGASQNVSEYETNQIEILPNQKYVLAKGKPTVTEPINGTYSTDYINIRYFLKKSTGKYLKEGKFNNYLSYTIQKGE